MSWWALANVVTKQTKRCCLFCPFTPWIHHGFWQQSCEVLIVGISQRPPSHSTSVIISILLGHSDASSGHYFQPWHTFDFMRMFSSQTLLKRSKFMYTFEYLDIQLTLKIISITISIYVNDFLNNTRVVTSKNQASNKERTKTTGMCS